jgi:hypothetical protein
MKPSKNSSTIITGRIYIAPSAYETWFITDALSMEIWTLPFKQIDEYKFLKSEEKLPV